MRNSESLVFAAYHPLAISVHAVTDTETRGEQCDESCGMKNSATGQRGALVR